MTPITLLVLCCQAMASINYQDINNHDLANVGAPGENMTENKKMSRQFLELIETIFLSEKKLFDELRDCLSSDDNSDGHSRKQVKLNPEHLCIKSLLHFSKTTR